MLGKVLESCHSIVVQVIHFSSVVKLGVAPFLPTNAMHVPNSLELPDKRGKKESHSSTCYNG
jgi:hypothetical protein